MTVAQFAHGMPLRMAPGNGAIHKNPSTHHKMTGTQIQCSASLVGLRWLDPYSSSHCSAVRMGLDRTLTAASLQIRGVCASSRHMQHAHEADTSRSRVWRLNCPGGRLCASLWLNESTEN